MKIVCASCKLDLKIPDSLAGKQFRCSKCDILQTAPLLNNPGYGKSSQLQNQAYKPCSNCGQEILATASICNHCWKRYATMQDDGDQKATSGSVSASTNNPSQNTKLCPFCGESIQAIAIKCKHCGERLDLNRADRNVRETSNGGSSDI